MKYWLAEYEFRDGEHSYVDKGIMQTVDNDVTRAEAEKLFNEKYLATMWGNDTNDEGDGDYSNDSGEIWVHLEDIKQISQHDAIVLKKHKINLKVTIPHRKEKVLLT